MQHMATKAKRLLLTDQIRKAIADSGETQYRICQNTGLDKTAIFRFMSGERGLSMEALNTLGDYLELSIVSNRKPVKEKNPKSAKS
jgi:transcriptional regulator with XRE-family HTH domain